MGVEATSRFHARISACKHVHTHACMYTHVNAAEAEPILCLNPQKAFTGFKKDKSEVSLFPASFYGVCICLELELSCLIGDSNVIVFMPQST